MCNLRMIVEIQLTISSIIYYSNFFILYLECLFQEIFQEGLRSEKSRLYIGYPCGKISIQGKTGVIPQREFQN